MNATRFKLNRLTIVLILLGITALVLGCSADEPSLPPAPKVNYIITEEEEITLTIELPGRISALMVSEVRPQVGGIIKERLFEEGADVEAGQLLYQIDPSLYEAAYNNTKADLARVEANAVATRNLASRYSELLETGAISKQEYDDAKASSGQSVAQVASAKEALETARINLSYTKVTAPVSGRIGHSLFTPGALVTQNQADHLAIIQQLDYVYVDITQSSTQYLALQRARAEGLLKSSGKDSSKVKLLLEDGSPYALSGQDGEQEWIEGDLLFSGVTIDQTTGAITLRTKFKNEYNLLLPGMYVRAVIEEGVKEAAIIVPQKTVVRDSRGRALAYVLAKEKPIQPQQEGDESKAKKPEERALADNEYYVISRDIVLDRNHENSWIVKEGLSSGDRLVMDGLLKLRPGQRVVGVEVKSEIIYADAETEVMPANMGRNNDKNSGADQPEEISTEEASDKSETPLAIPSK